MFDLDKIREIWQTISRNKTRSLLTAFGVFWGMFMFIFMIGIGQGFENGLRREIGEISPNSMFVFGRPASVEYKGFNAGRYWQMTNDDLLMLKDQFSEIEHISGMVFAGYGSKITRKDKSGDFYYRGNDDVYYTHNDIIPQAAVVSGDGTEQNSHHKSYAHYGKAYLQ